MRSPFDLLFLLFGAVLIGLTAAAIPPIVRAFAPVQRWMMNGTRPWVCDLCMSFWSTAIAAASWWGIAHALDDHAGGRLLLAGLPAFAITFALVRYNGEPHGPPPDLSELQDSGVGLFKGSIEEVSFGDPAPAHGLPKEG